MRCLAIVGAVAVAPAAAAPSTAWADASDYKCTIEALGIDGPFIWPGSLEDPDRERQWTGIATTGSALCTAPNRELPFPVSLRLTDATLSVRSCLPLGRGEADLTGQLAFLSPGGLRDERPFSAAYRPDLGADPQPGLAQVDAGGPSQLDWHFAGGENRCEAAGGAANFVVRRIDLTGSFSVPVSRSNPALVATTPSSPGHPDPIAISQTGNRIYLGSFTSAPAALGGGGIFDRSPSRVWEYNRAGALKNTWTISGQPADQPHGVTGLALDADGRIYVSDINPSRVLRLDPQTGRQTTYATMGDVLPCDQGGAAGACSSELASLGNRGPLLNGAAFGPDGSLYVTDSFQGLIWRVPPGGGEASVWFTAPDLAAFIGPNGIRLGADRSSLVFVVSQIGSREQLRGIIFRLQIEPDGRAGALTRVWTSAPAEGADSFALAASGNIYVALAGENARSGLLVLSPTGAELARRGSPANRLTPEVAYDGVADVAFIGTTAYFTNSSNFNSIESAYALFKYDVGDRGLPLVEPAVP